MQAPFFWMENNYIQKDEFSGMGEFQDWALSALANVK